MTDDLPPWEDAPPAKGRRKRKAKAPETVEGFAPYVVRDPTSFTGIRWAIVRETSLGVCAVAVVPFMPGVSMAVQDRVIPSWALQNYSTVTEEGSLQSLLSDIRRAALAHGATPLAVEWLGTLSPFSEEELNTMAEKLKTKGAAKPAKPAAAKAEKGAGKGKGNPAALEKAREAAAGKRAETAGLPIKLLVKSKDSGLRGGRLAKLQAIETEKPKTVGDILGRTVTDESGKEHTIDMGALRGMEKREHISIG